MTLTGTTGRTTNEPDGEAVERLTFLFAGGTDRPPGRNDLHRLETLLGKW